MALPLADRLRITRGALIVAGLTIGLSLVYLLCDESTRATVMDQLGATPDGLWRHGRVWTLATGPFLQPQGLPLILDLFVLWSFVPSLERFWGTARFYRFFAITSVVGGLAGTAFGLVTGRNFPIVGPDPFIYAAIVAFGIVYAKQPVKFFGAVPLTGRQLMYGFLGFLLLFIVLQQRWEAGVSYGAAMVTAAIITAKRSPLVVWRRWRLQRKRAKLTVLTGGAKRSEKTWIN